MNRIVPALLLTLSLMSAQAQDQEYRVIKDLCGEPGSEAAGVLNCMMRLQEPQAGRWAAIEARVEEVAMRLQALVDVSAILRRQYQRSSPPQPQLERLDVVDRELQAAIRAIDAIQAQLGKP